MYITSRRAVYRYGFERRVIFLDENMSGHRSHVEDWSEDKHYKKVRIMII